METLCDQRNRGGQYQLGRNQANRTGGLDVICVCTMCFKSINNRCWWWFKEHNKYTVWIIQNNTHFLIIINHLFNIHHLWKHFFSLKIKQHKHYFFLRHREHVANKTEQVKIHYSEREKHDDPHKPISINIYIHFRLFFKERQLEFLSRRDFKMWLPFCSS